MFQLDNIQGSEEMYRDRVDNHLVRCIVQLTIASQDDSLWRAINYQICLKTRSSESQVNWSCHTREGVFRISGQI